MLQFIYELYDPRTDIVGYVGITTDPNDRYKQHLGMIDGNRYKNSWISSILADSIKPGMRIREVIENDDERAFLAEKYWINFYLEQGIKLTNIQYVKKDEAIVEEIIDYPYDDIDKNAPSLTDWQVRVWRIGLGDANKTGKERKRAEIYISQLHHLFEINDLLGNVQGKTVREQLAFLRGMALNTPNVRFIKQSGKFLYHPEDYIFVVNVRELMAVVFP